MPVALALRDQTRPTSAPDSGGPTAGVSARLRAMPPRTRAVLALVVVVLTAAPAAITLARADTFTSTLVVAQQDASQASDVPLIERVTRTARGFETRRRIVALRDAPGWSLPEDIPNPIVGAGPRPGTARVTIPADTTREALDVARVTAGVITAQARRISRARAAALDRRRAIDSALGRRDVSRARRSRLREEAEFIRASLPGLVALRISDPPAAVQPTGLIDRLDPGGIPRPDPVWAGAVGLMLGLALCSLWLTLSGRSSSAREQAGDGHTS
jgi:hypothetical protein